MGKRSRSRAEAGLIDFLTAVPDGPDHEALRRQRIERFKLLDDLQFTATLLHELTEVVGQLGQLTIAVGELDHVARQIAGDAPKADTRGRTRVH